MVQVGVYPVSQDLIRAAKLTGTGQDAAAIDPYREPEVCPVLKHQNFAGDFSRALERMQRSNREGFRHDASGETPSAKLFHSNGINSLAAGSASRQCPNRIDSVRTHKHKSCATSPTILKEIMVNPDYAQQLARRLL